MHEVLRFNNPKILRRALTHRSYISENPQEGKDNERLEFLGDALLNFLCAEYLYDLSPEMTEAEMTRRRAALVDEKQLAQFAIELELYLRMRLGKGTIKQGGQENENLLSSTFEALIAAYYLDKNRDIDAVRQEIIPLFKSVKKTRLENRSSLDPKNRLQEIAQTQGSKTLPRYKTSRIGGTDNAPEFVAIVYIQEREWGRGTGRSKKEAEKQAAEVALSNLKHSKT
ncbi:MAG: ribonuclease III [Snowella sp.]